MTTPVYVCDTEYLDEGSAQRIIADAIRDAAYDAQRHQDGSGTNIIDCGARAGVVLGRLRAAQS